MKQIRQKVIIRSKARIAHLKGFFWSGWKTFVVVSFLLLAAYGFMLSKETLFQNELFLVKSISVQPQGTAASKVLARQLSSLKGKSIWALNKKKLAGHLKEVFPEIRSIKIKRSLPDSVAISFELRKARALIKTGSSDSFRRVDKEGEFISNRFIEEDSNSLTELFVPAKSFIPAGLSFLDLWEKNSAYTIKKIEVNEWSEVSAYLESKHPESAGTKIIWGSVEAGNFKEKQQRLQTVLTDLETQSLEARVVQLKDIFISNKENREGGQIVGKAFVQLSKGEPQVH